MRGGFSAGGRGGRWGYFSKFFLVGMCGLNLETCSLFPARICDFPYLISEKLIYPTSDLYDKYRVPI